VHVTVLLGAAVAGQFFDTAMPTVARIPLGCGMLLSDRFECIRS
jgi:hypothetical protein